MPAVATMTMDYDEVGRNIRITCPDSTPDIYKTNVTLIQDLVKPRYTVDMEYDGLNRLTGANGHWGNGTISYDGVGNIRTKNLGNQTLTYHY